MDGEKEIRPKQKNFLLTRFATFPSKYREISSQSKGEIDRKGTSGAKYIPVHVDLAQQGETWLYDQGLRAKGRCANNEGVALEVLQLSFAG